MTSAKGGSESTLPYTVVVHFQTSELHNGQTLFGRGSEAWSRGCDSKYNRKLDESGFLLQPSEVFFVGSDTEIRTNFFEILIHVCSKSGQKWPSGEEHRIENPDKAVCSPNSSDPESGQNVQRGNSISSLIGRQNRQPWFYKNNVTACPTDESSSALFAELLGEMTVLIQLSTSGVKINVVDNEDDDGVDD
ncbi:hypothetical protein GGX14DRAFT_402522 [Mycena pura]|uniref:Uncharacterized protein n=1 Tax=Mycena pura TaxID=153505 RepID=A0AAD6UYC2_9AGAR|nr:hypothetical protein GGX14DRAFT_402522 [Mycena pura]